MKKLFQKYKWQILAYIVYAACMPGLLGGILEFRDEQFVNAILISYLVVPIAVYTIYYLIKHKRSSKPVKNATTVVTSTQEDDNNSWSLLDFARQHGRMKVHRNDDGLLDMCIFISADGTETTACVSKQIKGYTVEDIQREKEELSIVTLNSGAYCLCREWETVHLS